MGAVTMIYQAKEAKLLEEKRATELEAEGKAQETQEEKDRIWNLVVQSSRG